MKKTITICDHCGETIRQKVETIRLSKNGLILPMRVDCAVEICNRCLFDMIGEKTPASVEAKTVTV